MINLDYLYNKDAVKDYFEKNYFVDKELHFQIIPHGTILPSKFISVNGKRIDSFGGIIDSKGKYINGSWVYHGSGAAYTPTEEVPYIPETVIYVGMLCGVWGHAITDNLRRLWFLKSETFNHYFKNCKPVYIEYDNWGGEC